MWDIFRISDFWNVLRYEASTLNPHPVPLRNPQDVVLRNGRHIQTLSAKLSQTICIS